MPTPGATTFDLIVATVDRTNEVDALLGSLEAQSYPHFRILLADGNDDDRLDEILRRHPRLEIHRSRSARGLSRARNLLLPHVAAAIVTFPDDDCIYPATTLERVARRFEEEPGLDGLTGRATDASGRSSSSWAKEPAVLTRSNLWNRAISFTIFLRAEVIRQVGAFDDELGLGSAKPWSSGEETEYLVRAVDCGARIEFDPELTIQHREKHWTTGALRDAGAREGASVGYILRKHRYNLATVGSMLARPVGGAIVAAARRDRARARFHLATLAGRVRGYRGGARPSRS
jgi:glycosyltransferase involved in cell wall biosynthesis